MAAKPEYDKEVSTSIVLSGLKKIGIYGEANGRNDLVLTGEEGIRKFSGSAYRETMDRGFHHGTLLLSADMSRLADYLNPDEKKLKAKGITSVKSRVINLNTVKPEISHEIVCDAIMQAYLEHYDTEVDVEYISPDNFDNLPGFEDKYTLQQSWEWNFGQTPPFTHAMDERFTWGGVEVYLDVNKGKIKQATIFSDMLDPVPMEELAKRLTELTYKPEPIQTCLSQLIEDFPEYGDNIREFTRWFSGQIE